MREFGLPRRLPATTCASYFRRVAVDYCKLLLETASGAANESRGCPFGILLRSRSGFSPRRDVCRLVVVNLRVSVSIPQWVFSPSRRSPTTSPIARLLWFQSRSGFSPRRDASASTSVDRVADCFNPAVGFLPVATGRLRGLPCSSRVSIPQWVFSPSRLFLGVSTTVSVLRFNPAVGFLPVATGESG